MTVKMAPEKLVYCSGLGGAVTVYSKVGQFGYSLITTVASVHYLHPINLLHVQQPYQCLLTILVIASVPSSRYESDSVWLQEKFTQNLVACRRDNYVTREKLLNFLFA